MQLRVSAILLFALTGLLAQPVAPIDARGWINKGVQEYKGSRYKDATESFQKAVDLDPNNVTAHLYLGTAWMSQYIDPQYSDAMAYMNLLIRERADLADSPEQYRSETDLANQWVQKALDAKKAQAAEAQLAEPPPAGPAPQRIRVGVNVQAANLIKRVQPVYPPLAVQARIQGTVRFTVIIGRDGRIQNLQLVSGHPLLVQAAREAASQWEYKPTLLNGEPVEVATTLDVNFTLP